MSSIVINQHVYECYQQYIKGRQFKIICFNIRSMRKNFDMFVTEINEELKTLDIIIIIEANINVNEINFYNIEGFDKTAELRENRRGGGIIMFIKNNLKWEKMEIESKKSFEQLQIKIETNKKDMINVTAIYKPKYHSEFINDLELTIKNIKQNKIIMLGDFNIDLNSKKTYNENYKNMLAINNTQIKLKGITREAIKKGNITRTSIDHIYTKNVEGITFIKECNVSDHNIIEIKTEIELNKI